MNEPAPTVPGTPATPGVVRRPRRTLPRLLLAATLLVLLCLALAVWLLSQLELAPHVNVVIDGQRVASDLAFASWPPAHKVVLVAVLAGMLLLALVVLPIAVLLGALALALVLLLAVGLPLLSVALVLALVLSPLWLLLWLAWRVLAPPRRHDGGGSTTMAA
jgi:hypothetical protein